MVTPIFPVELKQEKRHNQFMSEVQLMEGSDNSPQTLWMCLSGPSLTFHHHVLNFKSKQVHMKRSDWRIQCLQLFTP